MKIGTKITATNSEYATSVPNGTIMTVTHVFDSGQVHATVDGGDGFKWYMTRGTFEEYTPAKETGMLRELNVKAGDVVEYCGSDGMYFKEGQRETITADMMISTKMGLLEFDMPDHKFTIVSRASTETPYGHATMPDGRVVDLTANRVRCDLMDLDELEAMQDHGGPWEFWDDAEWCDAEPCWLNHGTYRVAPKPVVRTEVMYTNINTDSPWGLSADSCPDDRTHKITLTIKDNDIIDTKTEKL